VHIAVYDEQTTLCIHKASLDYLNHLGISLFQHRAKLINDEGVETPRKGDNSTSGYYLRQGAPLTRLMPSFSYILVTLMNAAFEPKCKCQMDKKKLDITPSVPVTMPSPTGTAFVVCRNSTHSFTINLQIP